MSSKHFQHWLEAPDWVWPNNFHPATDPQMVSPDDGSVIIDLDLLFTLQNFREKLDAPVKVTSLYRRPVYNARVGGGARSLHLQGKAVDLEVQPFGTMLMEKTGREVGFTGFGFYPTRGFIHLDIGRPRIWFGSQADKDLYYKMKEEPDIRL